MKVHGLVTLFPLLLAACQTERALPTDYRSPIASPSPEVSDALHNAGVDHFYFLPPMVPVPSHTGTADPNLLPEVEVCEWDGSTCVAPIAAFSTTSGSGGQIVQYDGASEAYRVNWKTDQCLSGPCTLDPAKVYRLSVTVAGARLGHADVQVVSSGAQLKNVNTQEYIGLVDGRTLPVRFRVELGLVAAVTVSPNPADVLVGESASLTATAVDLHGNPLPSLSFVWTSANTGAVTVDGGGQVTGVAVGSATISASSGGRTGTAEVNVAPACSVMPSDMTHWWRGEGSTTDIVGGDDGNVVGSVSYAPGRVGQAFKFGNGYLTLAGPYGGPGTAEITVMAWIQTSQSGPSAWQAILSSTDASFVHFQTSAVGGSAVYTDAPPFFNEIPAPGATPHLVWRHFALTAKSGAIHFYLDGVQYSQVGSTFSSLTAATTVVIGNGYGFSRPFPGLVDELQMYSRALSQSEIAAVISAADGLPPCVP